MGLPHVGQVFENYKILEALGQGGMGQVLLAEDLKLLRKVAIKFLNERSIQLDPKTITRFENEARILATLSHPNIVNIYTFGESDSLHYLTMEYVEGRTLSSIIERRTFDVKDCMEVTKQILSGLSEAHSKGILHRDVKPANILVSQEGVVKIVDFGISKNLIADEEKLTKENHFIGTVNYMAPELLRGHPPSASSDLFSVGVVLYELLVGTNPFHAENKMEVIEKVKKHQVLIPNEVRASVPPKLCVFITKLLAKDRSQRYQSALEALKDLNKIKQEKLPEFQGVVVDEKVDVTNRSDIKMKLNKMGYHETEVMPILRFAIKLQEKANKASQSLTGDTTEEAKNSNGQILLKVSEENLVLAIESYELQKQPQKIEANESAYSNSRKIEIPYPLARPKKTWIAGLVFLALGLFGYSKYSDKISKQLKSLPLGSKQIKDLSRQLSSIPVGEKRLVTVGTNLEYKVKKFHRKTGKIFTNQTDLIRFKKNHKGKSYVHMKDGKSGQWSTQVLLPNAFVPYERWYRKKKFHYKTTLQGNPDSLYPIQMDKKSEFSFQKLLSGGRFHQYSRNCQVVEFTKIHVLKQEMEAYKVLCVTTANQFKEEATHYISPDYNLIKSTLISTTPQGEFEEERELMKLDLPRK